MGEETAKKPFYKKWWVWALAIVIVIGIGMSTKKGDAGGSGTAQAATAEKTEAGIPVTALAYYKAYENNEVAADAKYKGKLLEISGAVESVDKMMGSILVQLKGSEYFGTVTCTLEDESAAAYMNKGDRITLIGTGDGKSIFPQVDDCILKK